MEVRYVIQNKDGKEIEINENDHPFTSEYIKEYGSIIRSTEEDKESYIKDHYFPITDFDAFKKELFGEDHHEILNIYLNDYKSLAFQIYKLH